MKCCICVCWLFRTKQPFALLHGYLGDVKLCISGGVLLELLVPVAFEVDGVDQHQPGVPGNDPFAQKIFNFT